MVNIAILGPTLRILDNPALHFSASESISSNKAGPTLALYVEDPTQRLPGAAYTWWTRQSLPLLRRKLHKLNIPLLCLRASYPTIAKVLTTWNYDTDEDMSVHNVYVNMRWGGSTGEEDATFSDIMAKSKIHVHTYLAQTIHEPWSLKTGQGGYYRKYTPFQSRFTSLHPTLHEAPPSFNDNSRADKVFDSLQKHFTAYDHVNVLDWANPSEDYQPAWASQFSWQPGEDQAHEVLRAFLQERVSQYQEARDIPFESGTSQLSPYLAHGEISPNRVLSEASKLRSKLKESKDKLAMTSLDTFVKELVWREFNYHLLYHEPHLSTQNHNSAFDSFSWSEIAGKDLVEQAILQGLPTSNQNDMQSLNALASFECWKSGHTGFPLIDAGMRQLWKSGWMHNRIRMVVASFLTKNLQIHWTLGEEWFWDTLVDADPANNPGNWQWVAGTGADAAPYFRIFSPLRQAERFDERCAYVRKWVPELKSAATRDILKLYDSNEALDSDYTDRALKAPSPASTWIGMINAGSRKASDTSLESHNWFRASLISVEEKQYHGEITSLKQSRDVALNRYKRKATSGQTPNQTGETSTKKIKS